MTNPESMFVKLLFSIYVYVPTLNSVSRWSALKSATFLVKNSHFSATFFKMVFRANDDVFTWFSWLLKTIFSHKAFLLHQRSSIGGLQSDRDSETKRKKDAERESFPSI